MFESLANLRLAVGKPWWLVLLPLVIPPLILLSYRGLSGLGPFRRLLAIGARVTVVTLVILAVAELKSVWRNDRMATLFLLDVSQSIPRDRQAPMMEFVNRAVEAHKRQGDMAGVIVFGKSPKVESPATAFPAEMMAVESQVDPEYTDLAAAIKLALATFPEDAARRIVILSDGNENRGRALEQALAAKGLSVQIDALPIDYRYDQEVLVEKVSVPPDVKKGETVNINVVIRASEPTTGTLQIYQKSDNYRTAADGNEKPMEVTLRRGINVFTLKQTIDKPNFYTYTAEFVPSRDSGDRRAINNVAEGFTQARGEAKVLLIEGERGEHDELVQALREKNIEVTVLAAGEVGGSGLVGGDPLPTDLAQLQPYDAVILGNVPKDVFTDAQQQMIAANVHDMGSGLIMLGGDKSFGAGGWMNSPVEKALPVDMQIKAMKVQGKAAMVMVMHASEIAEGNYWQKVVAQEALKTLSSYDYAGMLHWEGQEAWLFTVRTIGDSRPTMLRAIDRMTPGDMPDFDPSLNMAIRGLTAKKDAMTKHIVIISDGDPTPPSNAVINSLVRNKITVTAVLTAAHGNDFGAQNIMRNLATRTKGRFYNVTNPRALPKIYQKEARLISRPLIFERPQPWLPVIDYKSEILTGVPDELPPITGLVLTSRKENELVEVPIKSPLPTGQENPLLAHWTHGLGRSVAFTSDAGRKWTTAWTSWDSYAAFWSQVVRWALRPTDSGNLSLTLRREEGQIKVVVDALDKQDNFLNFLQIRGSVVKPDLTPATVELVQVAPGRYEGTIPDAEARGSYFVTLGYSGDDGTQGIIQTGVSVPYSDEYRELQSNPANLETLTSVTGGKVFAWKEGRDGQPDVPRTVQEADVFRRDPSVPPPSSFKDLWPLLLLIAALTFLADVGVRRLAPDVDRIRRSVADGWKKLRGREVAPPAEYMEKLRSRKAEVGEQIDRGRSATRFEPPPMPAAPTGPIGEPLLEGPTAGGPAPPRPAAPTPGLAPQPPPQAPGESYTNRLLRAKQRVWEERDKDKDQPET